MTTGKAIVLTIWTFVGKVMSLLFPSKEWCLLISWLQSPSAMILEPKIYFLINSVTPSSFFPSICHEVMRLDVMILVFFSCGVFSQIFSLSFFTLIKRLFRSSSFSAIRLVPEVADISPSNLDSSL